LDFLKCVSDALVSKSQFIIAKKKSYSHIYKIVLTLISWLVLWLNIQIRGKSTTNCLAYLYDIQCAKVLLLLDCIFKTQWCDTILNIISHVFTRNKFGLPKYRFC
jgi:hypothetical protein